MLTIANNITKNEGRSNPSDYSEKLSKTNTAIKRERPCKV